MALADTVRMLYAQGLGELFVLHIKKDKPLLGQLYFEKGKLALRDQGMLAGMTVSQLQPCWESGLLGVVTGGGKGGEREWESMTFSGLENCDLPIDLGKTRHGALMAAQNQYGENLINFVGSIYRGYQLMMEHHFLPVVLLKELKTTSGEVGLAISDLRTVPMSINLIRNLNDMVMKCVEKRLTMEVGDEEVNQEEFEKMFASYLKDGG